MKEQQFSSTYTGEEFFLSDHKVNGEKVLPGVAYLELARVAGKYILGDKITSIKNIAWLNPLRVNGTPRKMQVRLFNGDNGPSFEAYSDDAGKMVHSQGNLSTDALTTVADVNIAAIKERLTHNMQGDDFYALFHELGLQYGSAFRGIKNLYYSAEESLAEISLSGQPGFELNPGLLDSALQAGIGINLGNGNKGLALPFSIGEMQVHKELPENVWAYVTKSARGKSNDKFNSYDIQLLNHSGEVIISIINFVVLTVGAAASEVESTYIFQPVWNKKEIGTSQNEQQKLVILAGGTAELAEQLQASLEVQVDALLQEDEVVYFSTVLEQVKAYGKMPAKVVVVTSHDNYLHYGFVSGLFKSAQQEMPKFSGKVLAVSSLSITELDELSEIIEAELQDDALEVKYDAQERLVKSFDEVRLQAATNMPVKDGGVYLVTGGAGGLGLIFANWLKQKANVKVVVTGRRNAEDEAIKAIIAKHGVTYYSCDVSDKTAVDQLITTIKKEIGAINGIIHSAGVLRDSLIHKKTSEEIHQVFAPKIAGAKNLDEATKNEALDFMVFFSSIASATGNVAQSDYAAANTFLDNYAEARNVEVANGIKNGHTLSINWPLWQEGGMHVDAATEAYVKNQTGLSSLPTEAGVAAFEQLLISGLTQGVVAYGNSKILSLFDETQVSSKKGTSTEGVADEALYQASLAFIRKVLAEEIRISEAKLKTDTPFEKFGIDSILIMKLITRLEKIFDEVPRTLFFECQTLGELTDYFTEEQPDKLRELTGLNQKVSPVQQAPAPVVNPIKDAVPAEEIKTAPAKRTVNEEDIAIIGLGGKYPQAKNLSEFWENLKSGKDSITEIPADRWDVESFFSPEKGKAGKSYSKWGGFLSDIDKFDPLFFNISPREAELMDPQERLFIQTVWETIEDAGYTRNSLQGSKKDKADLGGRVGVYAGVMYEEYPMFGAEERMKGNFVTPGSSIASIANRVSYFFNFHGPSMALDTMCSSSLTAIHLACEAIHNGHCEVAIAGGVNLSVHPNKYLMLSQGRFVSAAGKCESFGEGGEGYVPGEGVGAVLLKPLSQAEADGDQIYGVIKATALNHGGKTNGYTVPNPKAQTSVIKAAIDKAGIDAEKISYIEAHGTGTSLGDPIEITGLTKAFGTDKKQFCKIGSVKSNIGHCESAAGISGVTKVLLQLKHQQLVPSLHSATLNPNIKFEKSPFVVQQTLETWDTENNEPRIAGISGFGAGGSNAHILIQEYVKTPSPAYSHDGDAIILLSAQNKERLQEQVKNLKVFVDNTPDLNLFDIAYTLQVGREAMDERLAFVAESKEDLVSKLEAYLTGNTEDVYVGNAFNEQSDFTLKGGAGRAYINYAIENKEGESLIQLWVKGVDIDWSLLYTTGKPQKISLPTYPFAQESYWVPIAEGSVANGVAKLHPLVHVNSSSMQEQQFTSTFNGQEVFLEDHQVQGVKMLPGAAYAEMARAAAALSLQEHVTTISDLEFINPLKVDGEQKLHISLFEDEGIAFDIYTIHGGEEVLHSQGKVGTQIIQSPQKRDVDRLVSSFSSSISGDECYQKFAQAGLNYGSTFKGIQELYYNTEEAFAAIELEKDAAYELNPGILDAAIQASVGIGLANGQQQLALPFSIEQLQIFAPLSGKVFSYVRKSSAPKTDAFNSYDIEILNEQGEVLVLLNNFMVVPADNFTTSVPEVATHYYTEKWVAQSANPSQQSAEPAVILAGGSAELAEQLSEKIGTEVTFIRKDTEADYFISLFNEVKQKIEAKKAANFVVLCSNEEYLDHGFISGLLKSANQESPKITGKIVGIERLSVNKVEEISRLLQTELLTADKEVRYTAEGREVKSFSPMTASSNHPIVNNGVYLITGGLGGLGLIFAKYLSENYKATTILTGRSALNKDKKEQLSAINNAHYHICDVADQADVQRLVNEVTQQFGHINGIIHSAGVIKDNLISKKSNEEITQVLAPKVSGVKHLDKATKDLDLDFVAYFSSLAGVSGNIGQADYASGNAYMDMFAAHRNNLVQAGKRSGVTVSINWPLWREGGMQVEVESEQMMQKLFGLVPMPEHEGVKAFEASLNAGSNQVVVAYGTEKVASLFEAEEAEAKHTAVATEVNVSNDLKEAATKYLKALVADELKIAENKIEPKAPFEKYGIDSVSIMKLSSRLEEAFYKIPRTLFFEYQTLAELTDYFLAEHTARLEELTNAGKAEVRKVEEVQVAVPAKSERRRRSRNTASASAKISGSNIQFEDIAIVGVSGRYPGAKNLNEFWENLKNGKDSIVEIPKDRWGVEEFYSPEKGKEGKSYSKWGGFLSDIDKFDPLFFNISPREAELMDPQERLFLQSVWETIEDAGYTRADLQGDREVGVLGGKVGIYAGVMYEEYQLFGAEETMKGNYVNPAGISSSIANRASYFFNFHGPSMAVDTMCSSSLTAIHLACKDIHLGEADAAIAGGVNISVHPNKYVMLSQGRFVSAAGRCESFGEGGEGYVPGEGVGTVMLKRLSQAEADGDRIYGVIKGSALNHGGKTNGYTVPNPKAQAEVIKTAIEKSGVAVEDISYIEAHGTGTSLGDPIEIAGLNKAFATGKKQFCKIGSVKSNIGHCESAAAVSGITKVLLQMQHKQLVPSLHSSTLNPHIDFEDSPFVVQQQLEPWSPQAGKPRIAGVSSFGAGGSNAHIIIQEYVPKNQQTYQSTAPALITLSAKNIDRLQQQATNLLAYLETNDAASLYDVAYTLQVGREPMEERLAVIADDKQKLISQLNAYLNGENEGLFVGNALKEKSDFDIESSAGIAFIADAVKNAEYTALANLWIKGVDINWNILYKANKPAKVSLPTYPFAQDRYWINIQEGQLTFKAEHKLHHLLHSNESDLNEQKFTSLYTGKESFLADYRVQEEKLLPGAAYLELAREAGERSTRKKINAIQDVSWVSPIHVNGKPKKVHISLFGEGDDVGYEVYTEGNEEEEVHSYGRLSSQPLPTPTRLDINGIQARLTHSKGREACYEAFQQMGLRYGRSFQGIEKVSFSSTEALSRINLPHEEGFVLSPGVVDCALQTCMTIDLNAQRDAALALPYSVGEVRVYHELPAQVWSYARKSENGPGYHVDLLNDSGEVLVSFENFVTLPLSDQAKQHIVAGSVAKAADKAPGIYYAPSWTRLKPETTPLNKSGKQLIVTGGADNAFIQQLQQVLSSSTEVVVVASIEQLPEGISDVYFVQGLAEDAMPGASELAVFNDLKALQTLDYQNKNITVTAYTLKTQKVMPTDEVAPLGSGIAGLLGAMVQEQPTWSINRIDIDDLSMSEEVVKKLLAAPLLKEAPISFRNGFFYQRKMNPVSLNESLATKFKQGGVYVILGGAGGIGKTTTAYLIKNYNAQVFWLGRRAADENIQAAQNELAALGVKPIYVQCDANNKEALVEAYQVIKQQANEINGLIHSAIVLNDMQLRNMDEKEFKKSFDPKSVASHNFIDAFINEPLDFVCFYSSAQGILNAPGQSNYAAGCTYKDSFAKSLNSHHVNAHIINWGYWGEVGIVSADAYRQRMEAAGIGSISEEEGMKVLETVLANGQDQVMAIKLQKQAIDAIAPIDITYELEWAAEVSAVTPQEPAHVPFEFNKEIETTFKALCGKGILQVLLNMGLETKQQPGQTIADLQKALGIQPKFSRLFETLIDLLEELSYLKVENDQIHVPSQVQQAIATFDMEAEMQQLSVDSPVYKAHTALMRACLGSFADILVGKVRGTDIMFPGGSMDLVSGIYKNNPESDYFNALLGSVVTKSVAAAVPHLTSGKKVRILEVGAGTGGTSEGLFRLLTAYQDQVEYVYTDLSQSFLQYAETNYRAMAPYLQTAILDIEKWPGHQGFEMGSYDIVLGANVVHATKNMAVTVANLKGLLKKDGLLIMNEIARTELFTTLSFGLLDGWWLYEDREIRLNGSPGLSAEGWKHVMSEKGFVKNASFPEGDTLSQQIIVGYSNGYIKAEVEQAVPEKAPSVAVKQETKKASGASEAWLVNTLKNLAADLIKLPKASFDVDKQFMDYGFDSIMGTNLVQKVNEELSIELKPIDIFNYPNITQLAAYVHETFADQLDIPVESDPVEEVIEEKMVTPTPAPVTRRSRFANRNVANGSPNIKANTDTLDIAIVGMSGQFGAADTLDEYWKILSEGRSLIEDVPADRWNDVDPNDERKGQPKRRRGSFLNDIDKFDPLFFKISGTEAEMMDPQQRLFLQHCWKAVEDAAINPRSLRSSKCGVYVGVGPSDYDVRNSKEPSAMWGNSIAILAARISYLLDLKGPAVSLDTACSSSLVAMDLGCTSLIKGDTDLVITGGVNVMTTSGFYTLAGRAGMLSQTGECYTFDHRADGFVPGEGVGVVVMKRLADAERDGDHIYGVIKASLTNQDGTSNGITAPSVISQKELEKEVYNKFKINPETITMVEAHGTGTSLGDPIEFDALNSSFGAFTQKKQFCSLGSSKTNVGHTLAAAGITGIIKIMLAFKHKQLPPSLNYEENNALIDFENSPFKIQKALEEWPAGSTPRRAAISSFGFSGTNSHMVLEEYVAVEKNPFNQQAPAIIPVSAKNADRLNDQVEKLVDYIDANPQSNVYDIAYTLQVGREAMDERLAIVASNINELKAQLNSFISGDENHLVGNIKKDRADLLLEGGAGQAYINYAINNKESKALAQLWVKGVQFDWNLLYANQKPAKISLPTYAFAKHRFWLPEEQQVTKTSHAVSYLHPLLHTNTSNLNVQKFTSHFNGDTEVLRDHKVQGEVIMPGTGYLEMARAAGELSLESKITSIKEGSWLAPLSFNGEQKVDISLHAEGDDVIYSIYSGEENDQLHSQGKLSTEVLTKPALMDVDNIKSRMSGEKNGVACYELFQSMGLDYGKSFRGIKHIYFNENEALSKITIEDQHGYLLHPGALDSALQTCIGLGFAHNATTLSLPFSVKEVNIYQPLTANFWAYVRNSEGSRVAGAHNSYDVDLIDNNGIVLVRFVDFVVLPIDGFAKSTKKDDQPTTNIFDYDWTPVVAEKTMAQADETTIVLVNGGPALAEQLEDNLELTVESISPQSELDYFTTVQEKVKAAVEANISTQIMVVYDRHDYQDYGMISGLLKTAGLENPKVVGKTIAVDSLNLGVVDELADILENELESEGAEVRYLDGARQVKDFKSHAGVEDHVTINANGTYIITGGAGGLGLIFADYVSEKGAKAVLVGRSELTQDKKRKVQTITGAEYITCDIADKTQVSKLIADTKQKYGHINGIIHSAGVIKDSWIINKSEAEVEAVFAPKIEAIKVIDEVTKLENLDFIALFSSMAGVMGNVGQSDYAFANAYLDNFARYRNALQQNGKRFGKTISINWPLWKDGGMFHANSEANMANQAEVLPLPTTEGVSAFEQLLQSGASQAVVLYGNIQQKRKEKPKAKSVDKASLEGIDTMRLEEMVTATIQEIAGELLKIPADSIDPEEDLSEYGFDSISLTKFSMQLNDYYELDIKPTVFYNYPTVEELANFLVEEYTADVAAKHNLVANEAEEQEEEIVTVVTPVTKTVALDATALKTKFLSSVQNIVAELLKLPVDQIDVNEDLADYGVDSIGLAQFSRCLNEDYGLDIKMSVLYNEPTLNGLVDFIIEEHEEVLQTKFAEAVEVDDTPSQPVNAAPKVLNARGGRFITKAEEQKSVGSSVQPPVVQNADIAIIAADGMFPGANDVDELWEQVAANKKLGKSNDGTGIHQIDEKVVFDYLPEGYKIPVISKAYQLTFGVFNRMLTDNNISRKDLSGSKTGVFIAIPPIDVEGGGSAEFSSENMATMIAAKISYEYNLLGPCEVLDAACTGSLLALHKAVQSIRLGECDQAIVGGVNVIAASHSDFNGLNDLGKLISADGEMKSFSDNASGFVRSEGVGLMIIKPLAHAKEDKNTIQAVIKGTSFVHGGKNISWDAPSSKGIKEVVKRSLAVSEIDAASIDYVELHGIANPTADAVELSAVNAALQKLSSQPDKKWHVSSIKPTVGHSELASGMASLLKVVKAFQNETIPGIPGLDKVSSEIAPGHAMILKAEVQPWPADAPRRAAVNSYAIGGISGHVILEEYTGAEAPDKNNKKVKTTLPQQNEAKTLVNTDAKVEAVSFQKVLDKMVQHVFNIKLSDLDLSLTAVDYDFDSVKLIQFVREINETLELDIKMGQVLVADTLGEFFEIVEQAWVINHASRPAQAKPVEVAKKEDGRLFPLSEGQKGLYFVQQLEPENTNYNVPVSFTLDWNMSDEKLAEAVYAVMDENPTLKARFVRDVESGNIFHKIYHAPEALSIESGWVENESEAKADFWSLLRRPFNLEKEGLIRLFIRHDKSQEKTYLLFVIHHIIFDGMSTGKFAQSLSEKCYQTEIITGPEDLSYFSFVDWEQAFVQGDKGKEAFSYWKDKLSGSLPDISLPCDVTAPKDSASVKIGREMITLSETEVDALKKACKALNVNMSVLLLGAFNLLVHKLTGEEDILVVSPTAGRPKKEHEQTVGYFVNMITTRTSLSGDTDLRTLMKDIKKDFIYSIDHAAYPFPKLISSLNLNKASGRESIFKICYLYQNIFAEMDRSQEEGSVEMNNEIYQETDYVYSLEVQDFKKELTLGIKYDEALFFDATIKKHLAYYKTLLNGIIEDAEQPLQKYRMLPEAERHHLLVERNQSAVDYPKGKTMIQLFDEQVKRTPNNLAVVCGERRVTYKELNVLANQLANHLKKANIPAQAPVCIVAHKGLEQVWGVLGILKAGGHYIPVKGGLPENRMNELIEQTEAPIVLAQPEYLDKIENKEGLQVITLEEETFAKERKTHKSVKVEETELAYIIFTSGSTGKPKGVMIDHRGAVNTLFDINARYNITEKDRVFGISDLNFDLSVYDIFGAFACGAALILPMEEERHSPELWTKYVEQEGVTVWNSVPQLVNLLVNHQEETNENRIASLRVYMMSGDWIPLDLPNRIKALNPASEIYSMGGATEGSIWSIYYPIKEVDPEWKSIPYGYPLGNQFMYVLDANKEPCPVNIPGDIYIGGIGVAKGYHKDPEKTNASFSYSEELQQSLYRTGDMGYSHPDGYIVFLGRLDGQVKINGFRVELGEIESTLQKSPSIHKCLVMTTEDANRNKRLVAYVVPKGTFDKEDTQAFLKEYLPDYMVPSLFVEIDEIPLSANGKVDKKALPAISAEAFANTEYVAPSSDTEKLVAQIWQEQLNTDQVGVSDDFFELGGDSLAMIKIVHKLNLAFDVREIQLIDVMRNPTVESLSQLIDEASGASQSSENLSQSVIDLRKGNGNDITVVLPGAMGTTEGYASMAVQLPGDGPVYGLQMKGLYGEAKPSTTIPEMAEHNLKLIQSLAPQGKVNVVGHSYAGVVVYEMLKQMNTTDFELGNVILLDCFTDPFSAFKEQSLTDKQATYFRALLNFSKANATNEEVEAYVDEMRQQSELVRINYMHKVLEIIPQEVVQSMWDVFYASTSASYEMAEKLNANILFVEGDNSNLEGDDWGDEGSSTGWHQYFENIHVITTPADHFALVNEPYNKEWIAACNDLEVKL